MIYHMLPAAVWQHQLPNTPYVHPSLAVEGFIHCTGEAVLLASVANRFYRDEPGDFLILCIDETKVQAPIRWEPADGHTFPHIYGPLNFDAVIDVVAFPRDDEGLFAPISPP